MIEKFKLHDYIGVDEYEALSCFDQDDIPEEKGLPRAVRRPTLAMLADFPIKHRRSNLQKTFDDKQEQELKSAERRNAKTTS